LVCQTSGGDHLLPSPQHRSWNTLNIIMVIGHFFVPFVILLSRPPSGNRPCSAPCRGGSCYAHARHCISSCCPLPQVALRPIGWTSCACSPSARPLVAVFLKRLGSSPFSRCVTRGFIHPFA
jgi:hypothetical protein